MCAQTTLDLASSTAQNQWKRVGIRHHHGIDVALFSLRSRSSGGIGEYPDIKPLISWCRDVGFDTIQLLPLNDTGTDASPYSARSAFALNPLHLGLRYLPNLERYPNLDTILDKLADLNERKRVDYEKVTQLKDLFLQQYYAWEHPEVSASDEYQRFLLDNPWLETYAYFKVIKELRNHESWKRWPSGLRESSPAALASLKHQQRYKWQYYQFVQFLCFAQLRDVRRHADAAGILLKGDLPILVSRESADVWSRQELFHLDKTAGAPPDMYAPQGQKWGFPIYNWDAVADDNYDWWKERLEVADNFYHLYRLDHVLGFFRIWAIPNRKSAKHGSYLPKDAKEWLPQGRKTLEILLANASMLPIGEDLGVVPEGVRPCLRELGICGTKVMRWERDWDGDRSFIPGTDYPPESLTTISTHDSHTLAQWWDECPDEARDYADAQGWPWSSELNIDERKSILSDSHNSASLFHINLLGEYLALVPELVWPNAKDERINVPGTVNSKNWSYRTRSYLEEIVENEALAEAIRDVLP